MLKLKFNTMKTDEIKDWLTSATAQHGSTAGSPADCHEAKLRPAA